MTLHLERVLVDATAACLEQYCNHQVIALDDLHGDLRKYRELHGFRRARMRPSPGRAVLRYFQQTVIDQIVDDFGHHRVELGLLPTQEELIAHIRVNAADQTLNIRGGHRAIVEERARNERRHREQMHDVVAEVGHEDGGFL